MLQDSIIEEIHRICEEYSCSFNHDLQAIFADLQRQQAESGRDFVNLSRKPRITSRWGRRSKDLGDDAENAPVIQLSCENKNVMVAALNKSSSLIHEIQLEKVGNWNLFKFSEHLQLRMEELLDKKKADQLTTDEIAELEAIGELDRVFTHINAILAAQNTN